MAEPASDIRQATIRRRFDWTRLAGFSARMSERKAKPEASFAAAAISGKEADPWRVGIAGWFTVQVP